MNNPVVLDTSAFISLSNTSDSNYIKAQAISNRLSKENKKIIIPGDIFTEIINTTGKKIGHDAACKQGNFILESSTFNIVETNGKVRKNALEKFQKQPNSVSFTDCLVMSFADEFETKEIFGFDESFKKNGYKRIGID